MATTAALPRVTETTETPEQKLARVLAENEALRAQVANQSSSRKLSVKVGEKGGVQIMGFGRFPWTPYLEQLERVIGSIDDDKDYGFVPVLKEFCRVNRKLLHTKADVIVAKK